MTDTLELFEVAGTTYRFPALPTEEDLSAPPYSDIIAKRVAIKAKAEKVKAPRKWSPPRPSKAPKAGDGTFTPKPDGRGATVTLSVRVYERTGSGIYGSRRDLQTVEHVGMIVDLAPRRHHWVSLWDGRMPVECQITDGRGSVDMDVEEYRRRFGDLHEQAA